MLIEKMMNIVLLLACLAVPIQAAELPSKAEETRSRRPVALAVSPDGSRLFVANRRSGSLSVVDLKSGRVVSEQDVGKGLAALALLPDGRVLAVDRDGNGLIVLKVGDSGLAIESRVPVADDPASLLVAPDGSKCVVASTGSHQLSQISWNLDQSQATVKTFDLPFAPLLLAWVVPGSVVVVADASGGKIGVVDLSHNALDSVRSLPAHNIRGLALSPDGRLLMVAHQTLSKLAQSSFEDVHWGSLVGNHLRILQVDALLKADVDVLRGSRIIDLGRTGQAAGDPGAIAFDARGRMVIALSGVHEVALVNDSRSYAIKRVEVGKRPSALVSSPDGAFVYVADSLDDTISVVDVATGTRLKVLSLGSRPEPGPVERGERLFFDARLSHDGWMSCQSCHTDGRDNGQVADTLTDGGFGAPKRVSSLLGVGATGPWGWLGTTERLEDQVRKSIETTMRGRAPSPTDVDDLTAYLRSLPPSKPRRIGSVEAVDRGRELFKARKCAGCHAPPEFTSEGRFDVGLVDEVGNRQFNPPSLRGVADRPPYLHDGRASKLPDVFLQHKHPRMSVWSNEEVDDLVAFLKRL
jgi:YVTN family beta-propeller protein